MSSAILNYTPTLNYIGAVDITTSEFGSTMYSVSYSDQIVTLGNVLMFEYKLIKENISVPSPATVTLGFISIENAVNSGISNQWTIAIPALNDQYDPDTSVKFAVRVYVGLFGGAAEVGVTKWSNTLDLHNPPSQPAIFNAYYNNPENKDLFVFLEPDQQIDYNVVNFVAAFYYQDASNNTVWDVSLPIQAQLVTVPGDYNGKYLVYVQDFGTVSSVEGQELVYVAVYAVYPFQDGSGNNFYSVSHVSTTYAAEIASNYSAPTVTSVGYSVYNDRSQNMTVNWNAPENSGVPGYDVVKYILNKSTDNINWTLVNDNISDAQFSYAVDVSSYGCGTTMYFQVIAVDSDGATTTSATTIYSQLEIFKYALAPQNLIITNTVYDPSSNLVTMDINFDTPTDNGCGEPTDFAIVVHDASGNDVTKTVTYNSAGTGSYVYNFSAVVKPTGSVEVYLITTDTNADVQGGTIYPNRNGASVSTPYIANYFVLNPVDYQVYVDRSQNMNLSWNDQEVPPSWELATSGYKVYYRLDSSDPWETYQTTDNLNMVFDAAAEDVDDCGTTINFYVEATLTNGPVTYVANSNQQSIKIFKYALAPQNLIITNTLFNPVSNLVTMDINFNTPANNGCGRPLRFAVIVHDASGNNVTNTVTYNNAGTGSYVYNFSAIVKPTGSVEVYLITEDTNSTDDRNGASTSTPYIANYFVLDPVDYQVYVEPVGSQNMNFSWNSQVAGSWSLVNYEVYYRLNNSGPWILTDTTTNTVSTFNASSISCGNAVYFYVKATLSNSGVTYEASSNSVSINIFKFATAPQSVQVQWASSNEENTYMDIRMNFSNPASNGCGSVVKFVVNVEDASGNVLDTQDVDYVSGQMTPYEVNFDNVMFSSSGNVVVYMITVDTNGAGNLNGAQGTAPYIADDLPIYKNVVMDGGRTQLTFDVITQTPLVKECIVATAVTNQYVWFTTDSTSGDVRVSKTVLVNNEYKYSVTIYPGLIGASTFPTPFGIGVSNTSVGIKTRSV